MDVSIIPAFAYSMQADGSMDVQRLGTRWFGFSDSDLLDLSLPMVIAINGTPEDEGRNIVDVTVHNEDGTQIGELIKAGFTLPAENSSWLLNPMRMRLQLPPGRYHLCASLRGEAKALWHFVVERVDPDSSQDRLRPM